MNPKQLEENYQQNKKSFHDYVDTIKKNAPADIYTVVNTTLIKNPYASQFPLRYFLQEKGRRYSKTVLFLKTTAKFYLKNMLLLINYSASFLIYKLFYKKETTPRPCTMMIDIFFLVDKMIQEKKMNESYFAGLYQILEEKKIPYCFLPRLYGSQKNPFKLIPLFKWLSQDRHEYLFEFELLKYKDFVTLSMMIVKYPFKTLRLLQKEKRQADKIFNHSLLEEISLVSLDAFSRYVLGKNVAKSQDAAKIYSWSEFQVIERSFNYGIRSHNERISLIGCQFYLNYETYFNTYVDEIDDAHKYSPHEVLVNGSYYLLERKNIRYKLGVSLRYGNVFTFSGTKEEKNILLLGSYIEAETRSMIAHVKDFEKVIFKNHPAVDINRLGVIPGNMSLSQENIYALFEYAKIVICTASGTAAEAVACGLSVIIIASQDNLTANPLIEHGKGEIWDIAFSEDEIKKVYNKLLAFRKSDAAAIKEIALWYKDNFFIEPTKENIVRAFELETEENK